MFRRPRIRCWTLVLRPCSLKNYWFSKRNQKKVGPRGGRQPSSSSSSSSSRHSDRIGRGICCSRRRRSFSVLVIRSRYEVVGRRS